VLHLLLDVLRDVVEHPEAPGSSPEGARVQGIHSAGWAGCNDVGLAIGTNDDLEFPAPRGAPARKL